MVTVSRKYDFECSILSMTMCASRTESVMIGVTLLRFSRMTSVRGSRVAKGESQEHSFQGCSSLTLLSGEATHQRVDINEGDFQAKYEKDKAQGNSSLLSC